MRCPKKGPLIKRPALIVAPSTFNAWSACSIEEVGFEAIHVSGSSISRAHAYEEYWQERPGTQQWRQWFGNLGKKEEEAVARLSEQPSH